MERVAVIRRTVSQVPELLNEWDAEKNFPLTPENITEGSDKKVWWTCVKEHAYKASAKSRFQGKGCPYCSGRKAILGETDLVTTHPEIAATWDEVRNLPLLSSEVKAGSGLRAFWICSAGHSFESKIVSRSRGEGCPYCSGRSVLAGYNDLATTHPGLVAHWNLDLNLPLTPRDVSAGSHQSVWWNCSGGHPFQQVVYSHVSGRGCPYCSGRRVLSGFNDLATTEPDLVEVWDFEANADLTPQEVSRSSNRVVSWKCSSGHRWESRIADATKRGGCPYCSGTRVTVGENDFATLRPDLAAEWDPLRNNELTPSDVSPGSGKNAFWICPKGHHYEMAVGSRSTGYNCPVCSGQRVETGVNDLAAVFPALAAEWDFVKNTPYSPAEVYSKSTKKFFWKCGNGHSYESVLASRVNGNGCPFCSGRNAIPGQTDLATTNPGLAAEWDYRRNGDLTPDQVKEGSAARVSWICPKGHNFRASVSNRAIGRGCSVCAGKQVNTGVNDLASVYPVLIELWDFERNEDDPGEVLAGTSRKYWWRCGFGHSSEASVRQMARSGSCPRCTGHGYNPSRDGYVYLLVDELRGYHQIGITNTPESRLNTHRRNGWELLDLRGPMDGYAARDLEDSIKRFLSAQADRFTRDSHPERFDGFTESWYRDKLRYSNLTELLSDFREWEWDNG